jgi:hypothetical protein
MNEQDKNEMSMQIMEDEIANEVGGYSAPKQQEFINPTLYKTGRANPALRGKTAVDELTEALKEVKEALTIVTALRKDLIGMGADDRPPAKAKLEPVHSERVIFSAVRDLSTEIKGDAAEIVRMANLIRQGW